MFGERINLPHLLGEGSPFECPKLTRSNPKRAIVLESQAALNGDWVLAGYDHCAQHVGKPSIIPSALSKLVFIQL